MNAQDVDIFLAQLTKAYSKSGQKKAVAKLFQLSAYLHTLREDLMNIAIVAKAAEEKITALTQQINRLTTAAANDKIGSDSAIRSLQSQIDALNQQLNDFKSKTFIDDAGSTEMNKLAQQLGINPDTGQPATQTP